MRIFVVPMMLALIAASPMMVSESHSQVSSIGEEQFESIRPFLVECMMFCVDLFPETKKDRAACIETCGSALGAVAGGIVGPVGAMGLPGPIGASGADGAPGPVGARRPLPGACGGRISSTRSHC